jgi:crotonobetainyl-CoA:carnitine CoA-transferase CaiB-like acyl-CoA transferase
VLSHLRVLDLTDGGAAIAGQMLADLGADVVLIEPPDGAASRRLGPFADDEPGPDRSLEFWSVHRGKRSLVVDLAAAVGRERLLELAETADVWFDAWTPAQARADGIEPEALAARNPALVRVSITPFGTAGPKADWAATDLTASAASSAMWLTGDEDRAPLSCSVPQAFLHAGAEAAAAALVALAERNRSGLGQHVDVSAQTSMMAASQSMVLSHAWNDHQLSRVGGGVKVNDRRIRFVYACRDGYANLTFLFGRPLGLATKRFFEWMHEEGYASEALRDEDWVGYGGRLVAGQIPATQHEAAMQSIGRFMATKTKQELFAAAFERKLLIVPLSDGADLHRSKQLGEREFWVPLRHADLARDVVYPGPFVKLSATPIDYPRPPPRLGEHAVEVWAERGAPTPRASDDSPTAPFAGLKVLDFTWVYAGPAVTRVLADYGATVVRLESSTAPDALRAGQPFMDSIPGPERSGNYSNINVGKLNLGLNLRVPEARDVALRLVDWADVVVENYSPKAMKAFGLDYEILRRRKPGIVMLSSCLSGQTGPERDARGLRLRDGLA